MAHKKAGGSTRNGRDSNPQYLGVKRYGNEQVQAGAIIVRQKGTKFHEGDFVGRGKDNTLYAKVAGMVQFKKGGRSNKHTVNIVPMQEGVAH